MKILSVKLDDNMAQSLEDKSQQAGKSPETILADVVSRYIHYSGWQIDLLEFSRQGAENGEFASQEEIESAFSRWGVSTQNKPAELAWSGLGLRAFRKELEHLGKQSHSAATAMAKAAWEAALDRDLDKRGFPGMVFETLEVQLGEDGDYCMAFQQKDGQRQILGVVPST